MILTLKSIHDLTLRGILGRGYFVEPLRLYQNRQMLNLNSDVILWYDILVYTTPALAFKTSLNICLLKL